MQTIPHSGRSALPLWVLCGNFLKAWLRVCALGLGLGLLALAALRLTHDSSSGCRRSPRADLKTLAVQLSVYEAWVGHYPTTTEGLQALVTPPPGLEPASRSHWRQLMAELPNDPWGEPYIYRCPGQLHPESYDLISKGPDRKLGSADDIAL